MRYLKYFESSSSDIDAICKKYDIENYTIENGLVNVDGNVDISYRKLTTIPLKFGEVSGWFTASHNHLTSLEGSPRSVGITFGCVDNLLTSLKGCPERVKSFYCSDNKIYTFDHIPDIIDEGFICRNTPIYEVYNLLFDSKEALEFLKENNPCRNPLNGKTRGTIIWPRLKQCFEDMGMKVPNKDLLRFDHYELV